MIRRVQGHEWVAGFDAVAHLVPAGGTVGEYGRAACGEGGNWLERSTDLPDGTRVCARCCAAHDLPHYEETRTFLGERPAEDLHVHEPGEQPLASRRAVQWPDPPAELDVEDPDG